MSFPDIYSQLLYFVAELDRAQRKMSKASDARRDLPAGSSRARVTSANARWSRAAEARDLALDRVVAEIRRLEIVRGE